MATLTAVSLGGLLLSCAPAVTGAARRAPGRLVAGPSGTARVIFVRPPRLVGSGIAPVLFDGRLGVVLGKSLNDSWFSADLAPGEYRVCAAPIPTQSASMFPPDTVASTGFSSPVTRLLVEADKSYFVRVDVGWESFARPRVELVPLRSGSLAEKRARNLLSSAQRIELARDSTEFQELAKEDVLKNRFDACIAASGDDLRLTTQAQAEGTLSATTHSRLAARIDSDGP